MEKKIIPMTRINTRIKQEQHAYIKAVAKKRGCTEGEVFRAIINNEMTNKK
jgi:hypothetical protein